MNFNGVDLLDGFPDTTEVSVRVDGSSVDFRWSFFVCGVGTLEIFRRIGIAEMLGARGGLIGCVAREAATELCAAIPTEGQAK